MSYNPGRGVVLTTNSSTTPLNNGASFTGSWVDVSTFPSIILSCLADQNGKLYGQFSSNGSTVQSTLTFPVIANTNEVHRLTVSRRYFRVIMTNDSGSNQTSLDLSALAGEQTAINSPANSTFQQDADATLVRPLDFNLAVAESKFQNVSNTIKDGLNDDIDTGSVPEDIINQGGTYTGFPASPVAAEIVVAGADTGTVYYSYMATDTDTDYTFASKAIAGAGTYALGHNIWRCNFCYFVASTTTVFNVGAITVQSVGAANVFAVISIGYSQSYCAAYTVPYNSSAYLDRINGSCRGSTSGSMDGFFWYRPYGESPRLRFPFELQFGGLYFDDIDYLIKIPARTDMIPRITVSSTNNLSAKISYRLVKVKE